MIDREFMALLSECSPYTVEEVLREERLAGDSESARVLELMISLEP